MFEGGVGFYDNPTAEISYGLYGIIGKGAFENNIQRVSQGTESLTSNMTKYALQGNFGYSHTFYEVDYSFRPTWVSYTNLIGDLEIGGVLQSELLGNRRRHLLFEHALTMKVGNDQVKMMLQVGKGGRKFTYYTNRSKSYLSFGMLLDIYSSSKRWF